MKNKNPLVSIVIPVYNGSNYLKEAIDSALAQTYKNIEIVVVNDGSTDDGETEDIALSYGDKIRYFTKENGGVATALNRGIKEMKGEYFSWLSHDDLYYPNKVKSQIDTLMSCEDKTMIVFCPFSIINESGEELYIVNPKELYAYEQLSRPLFALLRGQIGGCCLLIHKSHFSRVGVFKENLPTTQDFDLWFRMMRNSNIKFCSEKGVKTRSHEEQDSKKLIQPHIEECNTLWIGFMKDLSDEEKSKIDESVFQFYKNTHHFLSTGSFYNEAINFALGQMLKEMHNIYRKSSKDEQKTIYNDIKIHFNDNEILAFDSDLQCLLSLEKAKPRIAFYAFGVSVGGGLSKIFLSVADELSKSYEIYIIHPGWKEKDFEYLPNSEIKCIEFPISYEDGNAWQIRLSKLMCILNIDAFIVMYNCSSIFLKTFEISKQFGIKTIAWNHENYFLPHFKPEFFDVIAERNKQLSYADAVVWLTSYSANIYARQYPNGAVMPNSNISLSKDKNQSDTQNIIAVGRFDDSRKGIEYLLLAFAKVLKKCPKSKLTIVGGIDFQLRNSITGESINELITRLKIPDENLVLAGWVSDVEKYYEEANVHVLPSFYEGFGLVLLEAASYGMPSVVFDKNGYEDIIDDGSTGFIVESGNVIAMAEKIILLLSDSTVMTNMQKKLPQMLERFNKDVISNRWNSLIQAVLTKENTVLNEYLKKEFMIEISNPDKWIHDIISEYEAVLGRLWKYSVSQQACPSAHMEYSIIVPDLIKETSSLFANLHSVYGSMLEHSKANQSKLKIIQSNIQALYSGLPGQSQSLLIEENTTNVSSAAPTGIKFRIKRCCATVARKLYKPFRRIATDMGLKPFIKSTSIYKKLRVRGVIEKLNQ